MKSSVRIIIFILALLSLNISSERCNANGLDSNQKDTGSHKKLLITEITTVGWYAGSMTTMGFFWYKDQFRNYFAWQDDAGEWKQMDKLGHMHTSYYEGYYGMNLLEWAGMPHKKAIWVGGLFGIFMQYPIEVFDGFSTDYGASPSDLAANTLGTVLFIGQQLLWDEQIVMPKFSCHLTDYAHYRPNLLGSNPAERLIKDYNGQTYWLSMGLYHFAPSLNIPKWLNISIGYGANGMIGAYSNPSNHPYDRVRQYYLSLDLNLFKIKTKSKFVNNVLSYIGSLKIPAPTLELNENGKCAFHVIYF